VNSKFRIGAAAAAVALLLAAGMWQARPAGSATDGGTPKSATPSVLTVSAVSPRTQNWPQTIQASGPLAAWQEIIVSPETGGLRIAELLVDVGASVKRGQLLARLADDSVQADLRKQEAAVAQARANLEQAASNVQRAKLVEASGALSAQKIEEYRINEATARASLASAQAELDSIKLKLQQTRIVAVDDGIVSSKSAVLGNVVNAGAELFRLVRQGRIEWRAELDARQVAAVRAEQTARITLPGGESVEGQVRQVAPTLSATTGRAIVYVSLQRESGARAGMFASGTIELDAKPALTLPQSAIVLRDGKSYVFVIDAKNKVESRAVSTGRRQGDRIEVLAGLKNDPRIVASGGAFLSDGAQVTVAAADTAQIAQEYVR
jgi:RND family efflux transporter MFP subunit